MKKILFISDININDKTGGTALCLMHLKLLKEVFKDHFFSLGISNAQNDELEYTRDIRILPSNTLEKISCVLHGFPAYLNKRMQNAAFDIIEKNRMDIVFLDNSISGKLVKILKKKYPGLEVVCFFHDIEYYLMRSQLRKANILRKCNLIAMIENEKMTSRYADKCIVLNRRDAELFEHIYKKKPDALLPIVLATPICQNRCMIHSPMQKLRLLFVGANYYPNINGIRWFINTVMKDVSNICELTIVGYRMEAYRNEFDSDNVTVLGTVDTIESYYNTAHAIVIPLFEGGGMKVKTGESLIYGKTIIGTSEALTGYWDDLPTKYMNKDVYKCDTSCEFLNCIKMLYEREYALCNQSLSEWASKMYSFETNVKRIHDILL